MGTMDEFDLLKILNLETGFILIPSFISNLGRCTEVGLNPGQDSCFTFVWTLGIRIIELQLVQQDTKIRMEVSRVTCQFTRARKNRRTYHKLTAAHYIWIYNLRSCVH